MNAAREAEGDERGAAGADAVLAERALRTQIESKLSADRAAMAAIRGDLAFVHAQLDQINSSIIGLQNHSLRQTGGAALILAALVAIGWKMLGG